MPDAVNLKIVLILAMGFSLASLLGYFSYRLKLSPIIGYLVAGYIIGPYSPGFVADLKLAEQLAEIGVVLMMFGVGLHFEIENLWKNARLSVPGAIFQTLITCFLGTMLLYSMGWQLEAGIIFGFSVGVASTVVLVRILSDNKLLHTKEGRIAVGWIVVEDIITVFVLLLIPALATSMKGEQFPIANLALFFGVTMIKFGALALFMYLVGEKIFSFILSKIKLTGSHELFTLTLLAITFVVAVGASELLGTSIVLGAFLAGMVMKKTDMHREVEANSLPLKDMFVVIFFLAIGMLFDPSTIVNHFPLFLCTLTLVLIVKPLIAFLITILLKYPMKTALTMAVALAQIGEFSFILSEEAMKFDLIPDEAFDVIVASSIISIILNPLLFNQFKLVKA
jgi:monovalent cation:H+ antiporter-2, CPA2 family